MYTRLSVLTRTDRPGLKVVRLLGIVNGVDKQVDEPGEGVLVHGFDVGKISDGEEQNGRVDGDGLVAQSSLVDLDLCCLCYRLCSEESET